MGPRMVVRTLVLEAGVGAFHVVGGGGERGCPQTVLRSTQGQEGLWGNAGASSAPAIQAGC